MRQVRSVGRRGFLAFDRPVRLGGVALSAAITQAVRRDSRSSGASEPQACQSSHSSRWADTLVSRLTSSPPVAIALAAFFQTTSFSGSPRR